MQSSLVHTLDSVPLKKSRSGLPKVILAVLGSVLLLVLVVGIFLYFMAYLPAKKLVSTGRELQDSGRQIAAHIKSQDIAGTKSELANAKVLFTKAQNQFSAFSWTKIVPFAGAYYADGQHGFKAGTELIAAAEVSIDAIAPYADVIGLKGLATTGNGAQSAQDRITFITNTLDKITPQLDEIGKHLSVARTEVNAIDPSRYPEDYKGTPIRSYIASGISTLDQITSLIADARPFLEAVPDIMGKTKPKKYLVLFQNDAELRPTGGFLTGYAVIQVDKGKITTLQSDDIYKLDERFPKKIPAPEPILKYHPKVPYWYLRDQNLSPDFRTSMEVFMPNYALTKSPEVDGVIAVTTKVLVDLLKVTGKIGVPGYGNFSADIDERCDCPSAFYELQLLAGSEEPVVWDSVSGKIVQAPANYGNRKGFLGPVMYSILANVMAQPKAKFPLLFQTALGTVQGKQVMMYFFDPKIQAGIESFNMAGRVRETEGDYLMVVDTNFSGGKTNIWVKYKADEKIEIAGDGTVTKTLTLTYDNPEGTSVKIESGRKLNGIFRDWLRVYVPKGSELIEAKGFETGQKVSEDLGKTVFEGFFTLAPLNTKVISFKYKLPFKVKSPYTTLIQKQGGTKDFPYTFSINNRKHPEVILDSDKSLTFSY